MAESTSTEGTNQKAGEQGFTPITTQEEFDRLSAKIRYAEKAKHADYDELKTKADELDVLKAQSQTELQKAEARAKKAEDQLQGYKQKEQIETWKREVSEATGIKAFLLKGASKEEIEQHAQQISEEYATPAAPVVPSEGRKPPTPGKSKADQFGEVLDSLG